MAARKDFVLRGAGVLVVAGVLAGGGAYVIQDDPPEDPATAHLWVDTTDGTCSRQSSPAVYSDAAACGSFDEAWDAASAGDIIRVKAGTYAFQHVTGDKASETFIIGEDVDTVIVSGNGQDCYAAFGKDTLFCAFGANMTFQDITVDTDANEGPSAGALIADSDVTFNNVRLIGDAPDLYVDPGGHRFHWNGGVYGDVEPDQRDCGESHGEVVWVEGADNVTVENVTFNKQFVEDCGVDTPHLEFVRLEDNSDDFTLRNNTYMPGSDAGSGYIFMSASTNNRMKIIGNFFANNAGGTWIQADNSTGDWTIAYNTFSGNDGTVLSADATWVGNLGPSAAYPGCSGTHTKNVWGTTGSCGTDTFVGGASLGVDADGRLEAGSPAIDAGETPGASDVCTDSAGLNSRDRDGDVRPQGSVCDAGSDERP